MKRKIVVLANSAPEKDSLGKVVILTKQRYTYSVVDDIYFQCKTPLGVVIRTTKEYWERIITIKHPSIKKFSSKVKLALEEPDQVRKSKQDKRVHLYYKNVGKIWVCVIADHINSEEGYIITAYLTDRIKEGEKIYGKD